MERILSQEEISELLAAVQQGEIETSPEAAEEEAVRAARPFDLMRGAATGRTQIPNIDILFDVFGRNYGVSLTNRLQRSVLVKLGGIESREFASFAKTLPEDGSIGILRLHPSKSGGLVILDGVLSFSLIEIILGGRPDNSGAVPGRPMTTIEMHLLHGLLGDACTDLQKAFRPLENLQASLVKVENSPRLSNIVPPDAGTFVARFDVTVDKVSGTMTLVLPYPVLEPLREKLRDGMFGLPPRGDNDWPARIRSELSEVEANVSVELGRVVLKVRDILNFQVGDIIDLNRSPDDPIRVLVEGKPKFTATAGAFKGKKAARIAGRIAQGAKYGNL